MGGRWRGADHSSPALRGWGQRPSTPTASPPHSHALQGQDTGLISFPPQWKSSGLLMGLVFASFWVCLFSGCCFSNAALVAEELCGFSFVVCFFFKSQAV